MSHQLHNPIVFGACTSSEVVAHRFRLGRTIPLGSTIVRVGISLTVVLAACSPYFFHGAVLGGAAAPWMWACLLEDLVTARAVLPVSPMVWFPATLVLMAACAVRHGVSFLVRGWCARNAVAASGMNFHLYAT